MSKILVIEDNPTNRKLLREVLRLEGYSVLEADSADEGIVIAKSESPDLILMDIQLPGIDGLTATRILREDARTAGIPILAVTAHAMRGDERRILEAGCDAYISKPIAYRGLLTTVAQFLPRSAGASSDEGEVE